MTTKQMCVPFAPKYRCTGRPTTAAYIMQNTEYPKSTHARMHRPHRVQLSCCAACHFLERQTYDNPPRTTYPGCAAATLCDHFSYQTTAQRGCRAGMTTPPAAIWADADAEWRQEHGKKETIRVRLVHQQWRLSSRSSSTSAFTSTSALCHRPRAGARQTQWRRNGEKDLKREVAGLLLAEKRGDELEQAVKEAESEAQLPQNGVSETVVLPVRLKAGTKWALRRRER
ncbi:hypothetical protein C8R44DRAFT_880050 [Mycena epipterygia]|nr:hypothetical protein C8R44DRAFT_880050 [Mycena epipterygia]